MGSVVSHSDVETESSPRVSAAKLKELMGSADLTVSAKEADLNTSWFDCWLDRSEDRAYFCREGTKDQIQGSAL